MSQAEFVTSSPMKTSTTMPGTYTLHNNIQIGTCATYRLTNPFPFSSDDSSPNCAAYFFDHDADGSEDVVGNIKDLVTRADELVGGVVQASSKIDNQSRDASEESGGGEESESDMSCEEDDHGDSSCSHDMTLTMTSSSTSEPPQQNTMTTKEELEEEASKKKKDRKATPQSPNGGGEGGQQTRAKVQQSSPESPQMTSVRKNASATDISEAELSEFWDQVINQ